MGHSYFSSYRRKGNYNENVQRSRSAETVYGLYAPEGRTKDAAGSSRNNVTGLPGPLADARGSVTARGSEARGSVTAAGVAANCYLFNTANLVAKSSTRPGNTPRTNVPATVIHIVSFSPLGIAVGCSVVSGSCMYITTKTRR